MPRDGVDDPEGGVHTLRPGLVGQGRGTGVELVVNDLVPAPEAAGTSATFGQLTSEAGKFIAMNGSGDTLSATSTLDHLRS